MMRATSGLSQQEFHTTKHGVRRKHDAELSSTDSKVWVKELKFERNYMRSGSRSIEPEH